MSRVETHSDFMQFIGRSAPMREVYEQIQTAAGCDVPVLLLGETGTGKELAAQAVHALSERAKAPFISTTLASLPEGLVASQLFGHEKGSYTGAEAQRQGVFERGNHGTIFLDEINSISKSIQVSLLRLIEEKQFYRLGGQQKVSTDVRLIAASNQDLDDCVKEGAFRRDLFYRLDVFRLEMPPLRARKEDIPLLVEAFIRNNNQKFDKEIHGVSDETMELLLSFSWPGNVRELQNVIQRSAIVCRGKEIFPEHLPAPFVRKNGFADSERNVTVEVGTPLIDIERQMIIQALRVAGFNRKQAAELLGISRRAIYSKLRKHRIDPNELAKVIT